MIRYEDLMAARLLYRQLPQQRDVLLLGLEALGDASGPQRSLLSGLVATQVITMEQARYVHGQVEKHKRETALSTYGRVLATAGVAPGLLQQAQAQLGPEGDFEALGDRLVAQGAMPAERERQLRFQTRMAVEREMQREVEEHLRKHSHESGESSGEMSRPAGSSEDARPRTPSGRLKQTGIVNSLEDAREVLEKQARRQEAGAGSDAPGPAPAPHRRPGRSRKRSKGILTSGIIKAMAEPAVPRDVQGIVDGTLADADGELPGPAFRIPSFVDMSDARTGKQIGSYRILGRIGAGAMGTVYLADSQAEPEKPVAIKLLPRDAKAEAKGRFKREILANSFFSHPGALDVYDAGKTEQGHQFLAMEFFPGSDLEKTLDEVTKLPVRTSLLICKQVFQTLAVAHEAGVIHRDIKPGNILVSEDYEVAKLMDFGIALINNLDTFETKVFHTLEGGVTGTPEYMSPEQAAGESLKPASDIYSMGVVLYHCLSGRLPFESETSGGYMTCHMIEDPLPLAQADKELKGQPSELHDLMARILAKGPSKRPPTATAVVEEIDAILPKVKERAGSNRFLSFLGWRRG